MNWDYIAGFFDGEGCIYKRKWKSGHNNYSLSITQNDIAPLVAIKDFLALSSITSTILDYKGHHRLMIHSQPGVLRMLSELKDKCIVKHQKIEDAITNLSSRELRQDNSSYGYLSVNKDARDRVVDLWLKGMGVKKISEETGISAGILQGFVYRTLGTAKMREVFNALPTLRT